MAFSVPGYLPQEVYEAGDYIIGQKVILFDEKLPEESYIAYQMPHYGKETEIERECKNKMGKITGKYPILFILSFAFTQDEVKDFLNKISLSFRQLLSQNY